MTSISIDGARERLLLEIARCPNVVLGRQGIGACAAVTAPQADVPEGQHQVPEPWSGDLSAPILFISSNPSISTPDSNGEVEAYPTLSDDDETLIQFFDGRFGEFGAPVVDGRRCRLQGNEIRYARRPTSFWCSVRARAKDLLGREPRPGIDYAMTEVVHCKSRSEIGVAEASAVCAEKYLESVLDLSEAKVVVCFGAHAGHAMREHLGLTGDANHFGPDDSRQFHVCFLPHPNARGGKKGFDDEVIEVVLPFLHPDELDLGAFERFAVAFDSEDFDAGTVHPSEEIEPGVHALPWWESSSVVTEWHDALYDHHIIDGSSDYLSEEFASRMRDFVSDTSLLASEDLVTIRTVLTNISRGDRFCDGYMAEMFENGIAQAATRRLVELGR